MKVHLQGGSRNIPEMVSGKAVSAGVKILADIRKDWLWVWQLDPGQLWRKSCSANQHSHRDQHTPSPWWANSAAKANG